MRNVTTKEKVLSACVDCNWEGYDVVHENRRKLCPECYAKGVTVTARKVQEIGDYVKRGFYLTEEQYKWLDSRDNSSKFIRQILDDYRNRANVVKVIDLRDPKPKNFEVRSYHIERSQAEWLGRFDDMSDIIRAILDSALEEKWKYQ